MFTYTDKAFAYLDSESGVSTNGLEPFSELNSDASTESPKLTHFLGSLRSVRELTLGCEPDRLSGEKQSC